MAMLVRAFPILPGKEDAALEFARAVGESRRNETTAFLQGYGVRRETWHLQRVGDRSMFIVVSDIEHPPLAKAAAYASAQGGYERWFKDNVRTLSGVDPDKDPLGPPSETVFAWDSAQNRRTTLDAPRA